MTHADLALPTHMVRSPAAPSSPALGSSRSESASSLNKLNNARRPFARTTSGAHGGSSLFSFSSNGGSGSGRTSPTSDTPHNHSLPPSPGGPTPTRETPYSFSSTGSGSTRPSMETPLNSSGGLAPSPSIASTSIFGRSSSKKLEKRVPGSRATSSSSNRPTFSASELDGTFDLGAASGGSPGPPSLSSANSVQSLDRKRGLEPLGASEAMGLKRKGFYGHFLPKGAMEKQKYVWTGDGLEIPYWLSYGHGSQNW